MTIKPDEPKVRLNLRTAKAWAALEGVELRRPTASEIIVAKERWGNGSDTVMVIMVNGTMRDSWSRVSWAALIKNQDWRTFTYTIRRTREHHAHH